MESMTDLQQHIRKRLTEIEDLDERKDAREILLEGLVPIFELMEKRYLDLENQIKREIEIPNEKYAVSMTVITQKDYDPINGTLYPVVPALLQEDKEQEKQEAMPCIIYFAGSYQKKAEFEKAAELRDNEIKIKSKLEQEVNTWKETKSKDIIEIGEENIAEIISKWTGIPAQKLTEDENKKLRHLEEKLHERVVGQDEAVQAVAKAIRRGRVGLKDPQRPIGSFLFLGPTGVGKTELSKALSEILFDNENSMIRLDMSEYMEAHSVSKIIGSPPGYIGFDNGGQLTEKVRRKPYSVILFDEIEKAHPDVMNLLLQILEDGHLTDSQGREINFKNSVIIMTSNLGARQITERKSLGFGSTENEKAYEEIKKEVIKELKHELRPEFINRIDEIIIFNSLTKDVVYDILNKIIKDIEYRLRDKNIKINVTDKAKEFIVNASYDEKYGARPIKRYVQRNVETLIAEAIINDKISFGSTITIDVDNDKLILK